jgi:hypothetical protein
VVLKTGNGERALYDLPANRFGFQELKSRVVAALQQEQGVKRPAPSTKHAKPASAKRAKKTPSSSSSSSSSFTADSDSGSDLSDSSDGASSFPSMPSMGLRILGSEHTRSIPLHPDTTLRELHKSVKDLVVRQEGTSFDLSGYVIKGAADGQVGFQMSLGDEDEKEHTRSGLELRVEPKDNTIYTVSLTQMTDSNTKMGEVIQVQGLTSKSTVAELKEQAFGVNASKYLLVLNKRQVLKDDEQLGSQGIYARTMVLACDKEELETYITITIKDDFGSRVFFKLRPITPFSVIFARFYERMGIVENSLRFVGPSRIRITGNQNCWMLKIKDGDEIDAKGPQTGSIGVFEESTDAPGAKWLLRTSDSSFPVSLPLAEMTALVAAVKHRDLSDPQRAALAYTSLPGAQILDPAQCQSLIRVLEQQQGSGDTADLKIELTTQELQTLLGGETMHTLLEAFGKSPAVDMIKLRRVLPSDKCIKFHNDKTHTKTLQVPLNCEQDYTGGRLVFVNEQASRLEAPHRPAGSVTIHDNSIVHGVTPLTQGVRYGLFLLSHQ